MGLVRGEGVDLADVAYGAGGGAMLGGFGGDIKRMLGGTSEAVADYAINAGRVRKSGMNTFEAREEMRATVIAAQRGAERTTVAGGLAVAAVGRLSDDNVEGGR